MLIRTDACGDFQQVSEVRKKGSWTAQLGGFEWWYIRTKGTVIAQRPVERS